MSRLLAPDRGLDHPVDLVVAGAAPEQVAERGLLVGEEAGAEAALGAEAEAVAGGAEGLGDRGDEADRAGGAVGEGEVGGGARAPAGPGDERVARLDALLQDPAGD